MKCTMKLGRNVLITRLASPLAALVVALCGCAIAGCASTSPSITERLDPATGTTVIVVDKPIELLSQLRMGPQGVPFAYLAPFEIDRMGKRDLFLWVAAPETADSHPEPRILCDGEPLKLEKFEGDATDLQLSKPPYKSSVPWAIQWYFRLPKVSLECLSTARELSLETSRGLTDQAGKPTEPERYEADSKSLPVLGAFSNGI